MRVYTCFFVYCMCMEIILRLSWSIKYLYQDIVCKHTHLYLIKLIFLIIRISSSPLGTLHHNER
jgi:hypothetical protein